MRQDHTALSLSAIIGTVTFENKHSSIRKEVNDHDNIFNRNLRFRMSEFPEISHSPLFLKYSPRGVITNSTLTGT